MQFERERTGVVGISQEAAQGTESGRSGSVGLSHQSQLPAGLRAWPDRGRLPGGSLVSLLFAGGFGADHPGAFAARADRGRFSLCPKSNLKFLVNLHTHQANVVRSEERRVWK